MSLEKLFGSFYEDSPEQNSNQRASAYPKKRSKNGFVRWLGFVVLFGIILLGAWWSIRAIHTIPSATTQNDSLTITQKRPKSMSSSYAFFEKPHFLVQPKKSSGPIKSSDRLNVAVTAPNGKKLIYTSGRQSVTSFFSSLIRKALASESDTSMILPDVSVKNDSNGVDVGLPSLSQMDGQPGGEYTVDVTLVQNGKSYSGKYVFYWGILVVNADKDAYEPGDTVHVGIGMVDDHGRTLCGGDLAVLLTDSQGNTKKFATEQKDTGDALIESSSECGPHSVTEIPDYSFAFPVSTTGDYTLTVSAITSHGTESITQKIPVREEVFSVLRKGSMRIYPSANYTMHMTIFSKKGYEGRVIETVPSSFIITCKNCSETREGEYKKLQWQVSIPAGSSQSLEYTYDPPDISPALFSVGPLRVGSVIEGRSWAIAFDASSYAQSSYRFFLNNDSTDVGAPMASQSAGARVSAFGDPFRLRMLMKVSGSALGGSGQSFKLQYVDKGTGTCESPTGGSWTDVSNGGFNWNTETAGAAWTPRYQGASVVYNNKLWEFGGFDGSRQRDVYSSDDGGTWGTVTTTANWTARDALQATVFNGKMWILGGFDGTNYRKDVWYSTDGSTWTQATADAWGGVGRNNFAVVVFHDKMWALGGWDNIGNGKNDVWNTSDGANWTQVATPSAIWSPRQLVRATVFQDKIWVMSGIQGSTNPGLNDVWYSSDGLSWTRATSNAAWNARRGDQVITIGNTMYLMGGWDGTSVYNDAWYSTDGSNWTQVNLGGIYNWGGRAYMTLGFLNNKLYLMGGLLNTLGTRYNDVYSTVLSTIGFQDNTSTASPSAMTANSSDPVATDGGTVIPQTYSEGGGFTNSQGAIAAGQYGEWDFALRDISSGRNGQYCFRMVQSNGSLLDAYLYYPLINIGPLEVRTKGTAKVHGSMRIGI